MWQLPQQRLKQMCPHVWYSLLCVLTDSQTHTTRGCPSYLGTAKQQLQHGSH
jgi:hypothetical protein